MTIRVAIIGAGIGAEHLAAYRRLPEHYTVRCLCDLDVVQAKAGIGDDNIKLETDLAVVLADGEVDLVDICLPPHLHVSTVLAALDAGKAVICEKPIAPSLAHADMLARKLRQTGGFLSPVFQYRYGRGAAQLRALMASGLIGQAHVATLETHWMRDADYYAVPWRGTWKGENGGALLGHAIHIHDLLCGFLGPVASVFARLGTSVNDIEVEDCAALSLQMASGALVTSSVTLGAADDTSRLRIVFDGVTVESDHAPYAPAAAPWTFTARAPVLQSDIDAVVNAVGAVPAGFDGYLEAVARGLQGDPSDMVTLADGRRSVEFVTACYASSRANRSVDLPYESDAALYDSWLP